MLCTGPLPILKAMVSSPIRLTTVPGFDQLVERFVLAFTQPGDLVLDPFAGSGETMATALRLGRRGLGVEIVPDLVRAARERVGDEAVIEGDARRLADLTLPVAELVVTSPPFMTASHHPQNPLSGYQTLDGNYARYLASLRAIVAALAARVRPSGRIVLNVWNFWHGELYTPLADDVERTLSGLLPLEQVVEIRWAEFAAAPVDDRCLVYRVPSDTEPARLGCKDPGLAH